MNVVEKYGGTSVGTIAQIKAVAAHAAKLKAQGDQVVIVASAMGKTTNKLIAMAKEIGEHVNERELDSLLSTGEQRTITLLAMAIDALGVPAVSLTGYQCGFITSDHHSHARIMDIDITRLKQHLEDDKVVVVAGFQGANEVGDITTLGRGGSIPPPLHLRPSWAGSAISLPMSTACIPLTPECTRMRNVCTKSHIMK